MSTTIEQPLFATSEIAPRLVRVSRRGPLLRPSPTTPGVYGLDLTAGCSIGCPFCHIRGSSRDPGPGRVLFDPSSSQRLPEALDELEMLPRQVVLSPSSDPLPFERPIRAETLEILRILLGHGIHIQMMTRGRFSRRIVDLLASHPEKARVAIALASFDKGISRILEPRAGSPLGRLADARRLTEAGVEVEIRLEPLIPDRTDTRAELRPLFEAIAATGVRRVVAHYLYLPTALGESLDLAFQPLPWGEGVRDDFEGGRVFRLGSVGPTKHLPLEVRRAGLARLISLGAEFGLSVTTGASQNPELPRLT